MYQSKSGPAPVDSHRLSYVRLLCLTCGLGGLQTVWALIISHGSPYLTSLGLSRSTTALVWASSPACGFLQPIIGIISDRSQYSWGRRRPFVLVGTVASMICILGLAWVEELFRPIGANWTQAMAVLFVVLLNVSMTPLGFGLRSLITDLVVAEEQSRVTAWANYSTFVANIICLCTGSLDLPQLLGSSSLTQFQALSIVACLSLTITISICLRTSREKNPKFDLLLADPQPIGVVSVLKSIREAYGYTPTRIKRVFKIQIFAWSAWFPFLFYMTSYVNSRYALSQIRTLQGRTDIASLLQETKATRIGSTALLLWTIVSFITTLVLTRTVRDIHYSESHGGLKSAKSLDPKSRYLSMPRVWTFAHFLFAICMILTLVIRSWPGTVVLVSMVGCSWAATQWIPHAIVGAEISPKQHSTATNNDKDVVIVDDEDMVTHRGAILGLHNLAISTPQIFAALASSAIMWIMTNAGSIEPSVWILRVAAIPAMIAATLALRLDG